MYYIYKIVVAGILDFAWKNVGFYSLTIRASLSFGSIHNIGALLPTSFVDILRPVAVERVLNIRALF